MVAVVGSGRAFVDVVTNDTVARVALVALALMTAFCIGASGVGVARLPRAFVHIAADNTVTGKTWITGTGEISRRRIRTGGIRAAIV